MNKADIIFLSDAHLGVTIKGFEQREQYLCEFLRSITPQTQQMFLVGDIFDFWIEYRRLIRADYFGLLYRLKAMVESGVEIHYVAGNHDFALGPFLSNQIGIIVHDSAIDCVLQDRRVHIVHGDGLLKTDLGYRLLKAILRNRFNQAAYKMLHPSIGIFVASRFSRVSRLFNRTMLSPWIRESYRKAGRKILDSGPEIVVMGHTHFAEIVTGEGKTYVNTGEWLRTFSYARLRDGNTSLMRHVSGGQDETFESLSWNSGSNAS